MTAGFAFVLLDSSAQIHICGASRDKKAYFFGVGGTTELTVKHNVRVGRQLVAHGPLSCTHGCTLFGPD